MEGSWVSRQRGREMVQLKVVVDDSLAEETVVLAGT